MRRGQLRNCPGLAFVSDMFFGIVLLVAILVGFALGESRACTCRAGVSHKVLSTNQKE